jgi:hypothetical protein
MSCIDSSCFVYICPIHPILTGSCFFPWIFAEEKPWPTETDRRVVLKRYLADPAAPVTRPYNKRIQVLTRKADAPFLWRAANKGVTRREAPTLLAIRRAGVVPFEGFLPRNHEFPLLRHGHLYNSSNGVSP